MGIPVFDAHCDTIYRVMRYGGSLRENRYHLDLVRGGRFSPYVQVFAVFARPWKDRHSMLSGDYSRDWPEDVLKDLGERLLSLLLAELEGCGDLVSLCRSTAEAKAAAEKGKNSAFIAVEGAELLGCDVDTLKRAYHRGVRLVNLCWNYDNPLCGAANGPEKGGLTDRGRAFVEEMQAMGMVVDLSHASELTFWDVAEMAKRPIIAGHSNSKSICDNPRNLTDSQFQELVRLGGAAGLNLCPDFLSGDGRADIDSVIRHCEHFLALGGERAVCLGGDLDGIDRLPEGIRGVESYGEIYEAMLRRNYPESLVRDIFYNNLMNVLERAL